MEIAQKNFTTEKRFPMKTIEFNPKMNDSENTHDSRLTTHDKSLTTHHSLFVFRGIQSTFLDSNLRLSMIPFTV